MVECRLGRERGKGAWGGGRRKKQDHDGRKGERVARVTFAKVGIRNRVLPHHLSYREKNPRQAATK